MPVCLAPLALMWVELALGPHPNWDSPYIAGCLGGRRAGGVFLLWDRPMINLFAHMPRHDPGSLYRGGPCRGEVIRPSVRLSGWDQRFMVGQISVGWLVEIMLMVARTVVRLAEWSIHQTTCFIVQQRHG